MIDNQTKQLAMNAAIDKLNWYVLAKMTIIIHLARQTCELSLLHANCHIFVLIPKLKS